MSDDPPWIESMTPPPVTRRFNPNPDITAWEFVQIWMACGLEIDMVESDITPEIARHFKEAGE